MKNLLKFLVFTFFIIIFNNLSEYTYAQIVDPHPNCPADKPACWNFVKVEQWACNACSTYDRRCFVNTTISCPRGDVDCLPYGGGPCINFCTVWPPVSCRVVNEWNMCVAATCRWDGTITTCAGGGALCTENTEIKTYGCCGPAVGSTASPSPGSTPAASPVSSPIPTPAAGIPDCWMDTSLSTPVIPLGGTGNFTANLVSSTGNLSGLIFYDNIPLTYVFPPVGSSRVILPLTGVPGVSGNISGSWTPLIAGNYVMCCSATNATGQCRPGGYGGTYDCSPATGNSCMTVVVTGTGTVRARGVNVTAAQNICANITNPAATPFPGSDFYINDPSTTQIQTADYVSWVNRPTGNYTLNVNPPATYTNGMSCWNRSDGASGNGNTASLINGTTLTWNVGLILARPWYKAVGGNIHANGTAPSGNIQDYVPASYYLINPITGYPRAGIASYRNNTIFDTSNDPPIDPVTGFLTQDAQHTQPVTNYYNYYFGKFENKTNLASLAGKPAYGLIYPAVKLYIKTGMGTHDVSGDWSSALNRIGAAEKYVIFVPGDLTISTNITVAQGGFLAFIVSGNIYVADSVGKLSGTYIASVSDPIGEPDITGVFITDLDFYSTQTGSSDRQLVAAGTYVANNFSLTRSLTGSSNSTNPAEMFVYRADLWRYAPLEMLERDIFWQEVAP